MSRRTNITATQVLSMVRSQDFRCALSGRSLTPETASLDHIVPLGRGGRHALENLWVVDHRINLAKGTMTLEEFIAMCREVVRHHDTAGAARLANASTDMASRQGGMVPPEKTLFSSGHAE